MLDFWDLREAGDSELWEAAVTEVRTSPELRDAILRSVMFSMECAGFEVERSRSEVLLDRALNGLPLLYPGCECD